MTTRQYPSLTDEIERQAGGELAGLFPSVGGKIAGGYGGPSRSVLTESPREALKPSRYFSPERLRALMDKYLTGLGFETDALNYRGMQPPRGTGYIKASHPELDIDKRIRVSDRELGINSGDTVYKTYGQPDYDIRVRPIAQYPGESMVMNIVEPKILRKIEFRQPETSERSFDLDALFEPQRTQSLNLAGPYSAIDDIIAKYRLGFIDPKIDAMYRANKAKYNRLVGARMRSPSGPDERGEE